MTKELAAILAHKIEKESICYKVQWKDMECAWVAGDLLDNEKTRGWLVDYWKDHDLLFKNVETQTDSVSGFEVHRIFEDAVDSKCSFVAFEQEKWPIRSKSSIPVEILSLDFASNKALVQYYRDSEPVEMDLSEVKNSVPVLVCEFCLKMK